MYYFLGEGVCNHGSSDDWGYGYDHGYRGGSGSGDGIYLLHAAGPCASMNGKGVGHGSLFTDSAYGIGASQNLEM